MAACRCAALVFLLLVAAWVAPGGVTAAAASGGFDPGQVLTIGNDYILLGVTKGGSEAGRFALETTGGSPDRSGDDGKPLIYGRPRPWTSYTTVKVDGRDFVFGGPSATRAGGNGEYGALVKPPTLVDGAVETSCTFGGLEVEQILELAESSTSGLADTVRIVYRVVNRDSVPHRVGVRIVLDTMLGENDGAPIRLGERTLTGDSAASGGELPSFWQAFDSLSEPRVMAQGTVADSTTVRPDRIVVSNWGNLADHLWDVPLVPGREFVREGEDELDSAVAVFWNERPLNPGESRLYATAYGLGGVTIIPGELTLGITAPASVVENADGSAVFPVVVYVENVGKWPASDVTALLRLPEEMTLDGGELRRPVGMLPAGGGVTLAWQVRVRGLAGTVQRLRVEVAAAGLETVAGERAIRVQGPPQLRVQARPLPAVRAAGDSFSPERVTVEAEITNSGPSQARLTRASLQALPGWKPAPLEKVEKYLGSLDPGESRVVRWVVNPEARGAKDARMVVTAVAANARPATTELHGEVPALAPRLYPALDASSAVKAGEAFRVDLRFANIEALEAAEVEVRFDPAKVVVVGVSRGTALVSPGGAPRPFSVEGVDNAAGRVLLRGRPGSGGPASGTLATLHFLAAGSGETEVRIGDATVYCGLGDQKVEVGALRVRIEAGR